jgi:putrescine transport system permease protein
MLQWAEERTLALQVHIGNYAYLWQDPLYLGAY